MRTIGVRNFKKETLSELQEQRSINVKNHRTSFKEIRTGQKQDEWIKTGKVLGIFTRKDVITRAAGEQREVGSSTTQ